MEEVDPAPLDYVPDQDWGMGEAAPVSAEQLQLVVQQRWDDRIETMDERLPDDHEPVAVIDGKRVRARSMTIKAMRKSKTYAVDIAQNPGEHKAALTAGVTVLTVAGLLAAIHTLGPRKKK